MKLGKHATAGLFTLALPMVAIVIMIAMNFGAVTGTEYRLKITGYDPVDLLRGHYLTYRYDWSEQTISTASCSYADTCCACLWGDPLHPDVTIAACGTCEAGMEVLKQSSYQPIESARRVYVPEEKAVNLDQKLRDTTHTFEVGVVPDSTYKTRVRELYVDGKTVQEFFMSVPAQQP